MIVTTVAMAVVKWKFDIPRFPDLSFMDSAEILKNMTDAKEILIQKELINILRYDFAN